MSKSSAFKGAIFEWFVKKILKSTGFIDVKPDNLIVYKGSAGLMIHGLGQVHNADVLMDPPFQIPFYFPSRLLIECKAYDDKIGLPIVRGLLGLREDINNFEIITPQVLEKRKNYRRELSDDIYDRFTYQVALVTLNCVTIPAQEFAIIHHIPIISLYKSSRYDFFRSLIRRIDESFCNSLNLQYEQIMEYFKNKTTTFPEHNYNQISINEIKRFTDKAESLFEHMLVGVLENGNIIFLYSEIPNYNPERVEIRSEIHWNDEHSEWWINPSNDSHNMFYFELPTKIYNDWADKQFDKRVAIDIKEKEFKRISVFGMGDGRLVFFILKLDINFILNAKRNLDDNNN